MSDDPAVIEDDEATPDVRTDPVPVHPDDPEPEPEDEDA